MTTVVKCTPRKPNWTLYIGREWAGIPASKWQNPFKVSIYGSARCLELYEQYVRDHEDLMAALHEIDDQVLAGAIGYPLVGHRARCSGVTEMF